MCDARECSCWLIALLLTRDSFQCKTNVSTFNNSMNFRFCSFGMLYTHILHLFLFAYFILKGIRHVHTFYLVLDSIEPWIQHILHNVVWILMWYRYIIYKCLRHNLRFVFCIFFFSIVDSGNIAICREKNYIEEKTKRVNKVNF